MYRPSEAESAGEGGAADGWDAGARANWTKPRRDSEDSWTSSYHTSDELDDMHSLNLIDMNLGSDDIRRSISVTQSVTQDRQSGRRPRPSTMISPSTSTRLSTMVRPNTMRREATATPGGIHDSPPTSPASIISNPEVLSGDQKKYFESRTEEQLEDLDRVLQNCHDNIDAMKRWWTSNRSTWRRKKNELTGIRENLVVVMNEAQTDPIFNPRRLVDANRKEQEALLWFEENRRLMKAVWERFKIASGRAEKEVDPRWEEISQPSPRAKIYYYASLKVRQRLPFEYQSPSTVPGVEVADKWLVEVASAKWYYDRVEEDFSEHMDRLKRLVTRLEKDKLRCEQLTRDLQAQFDAGPYTTVGAEDKATDMKVRVLRKEKRLHYKTVVADVIEQRRLERVAILEGDDATNLKAYKLKTAELTVVLYMLNDQISFLDIILNVIDLQREELVGHELHPRNLAVFRTVHHLCWLYQERRRISHEVRDIMSDDELNVMKKTRIIDRVELDHEGWGILEPPVITKGRYRSGDLWLYLARHQQRHQDLLAMRKEVDILILEISPLILPNYRLRATDVHSLFYRPYNSPRVPHSRLGWGSSMFILDAKAILESTGGIAPGEARPNMAQKLGDFFLSPDVFPSFHPRYQREGKQWRTEEWCKAVNDKLHKDAKLDARVLEAFLIYCTHTDELFRRDFFTRDVYPIDGGWETAGENRKSTSLRRTMADEQIEPPFGYIKEIEDALLKNSDDLLDEKQQIEMKTLLDVINKDIKKKRRLQLEDIPKLAKYWGSLGRIYIIGPKTGLTSDTLWRLDAGWGLDPADEPTPIRKRHRYTQPVLDTIMKTEVPGSLMKVNRETGSRRSTEEALYKFWFTTKEEGKERIMNWDITRHKWHMFLRWCTATSTSRLFRLYRSGNVRIDVDQWKGNELPRRRAQG